ncbi:MAG: 23S rRNA (guanosine(2251)-2'-O)-methyltransferase RlmB [Ferrimicrobium sp.]
MTTVGGEQVEGVRSVYELLRANRREVRELWIANGREGALSELAERARHLRIPVRQVPPSRLRQEAYSENPQGVVAWAEPIIDEPLESLIEAPGPAFILVLDHVEDPQNLGAILRSAAAAGVSGVVLPAKRSSGLSATVTKVASGAIEYLRFATVAGIPSALNLLERGGIWRIGLDAQGPTSIFSTALAHEPLALVIGGEGSGLHPLTKKRCDALCAIPMKPSVVASLNASAAAAVALFAIRGARVGS